MFLLQLTIRYLQSAIASRFAALRVLLCVGCALCGVLPAYAADPLPPAVEQGVQPFLDALPGPLKSYQVGEHSAATLIEGAGSYYGVSPRLLLALLEATNTLLSDANVAGEALQRPFGAAGPDGFAAQLDWAARELRAGYGPYPRPPTLSFTDGTTLTLTLDQAAEGVAVQRFMAKNRTQAEWRAVYDRFVQAFEVYFHNELPTEPGLRTDVTAGFLHRPWQEATTVVHLAYFDHMYPTVDSEGGDNGYVVNYMGRGGVQYDGHDGHDYFFPDQPVGTLILAAADGIAYARTHRGFGVVIAHPGGYETVYWHLDQFSRRFIERVDSDVGVPVKAGDVIGSSGKTGFTTGTPHLHFEVRHHGKMIDPYGWYGSGDDPCVAYALCAAGTWLWHPDLAGEFDFTPPLNAVVTDTTPPTVAVQVVLPKPPQQSAHPDEPAISKFAVGQSFFDALRPDSQEPVELTTPDILPFGLTTTALPRVTLALDASDDAGVIVGVRIGINGTFGDPQSYTGSYDLSLPAIAGIYTITAQVFDRAGNSASATTSMHYTPSNVFLPLVVAENAR